MNNGIWNIVQKVDLAKGVDAGALIWKNALMIPGDKQAHKWTVSVYENGVPFDLEGAFVTGYFVRIDGNPVVIRGEIIGNVASVVFATECYAFPGTLRGIMKITSADSSVIATIAETYFTIGQNVGGSPVDPGNIFPSVDELIAKLAELNAGLEKLRNSEIALNTDYANALKRNMSGVTVTANDVSSLEHAVNCKIQSLNKYHKYTSDTSGEHRGVNVTYNADGTITLDGQSNDSAIIYLVDRTPLEDYGLERNVQYHFNRWGSESSGYYMRLFMFNYNGGRPAFNSSDSSYRDFTFKDDDTHIQIFLYISRAGINFNHEIVKPVISVGNVDIPYTARISDLTQVQVTRKRPDGTDSMNFIPSADGTVTGMTSLSPAMEIVSNNVGALIKATYNRDAIKVIDTLSDRIAALEGASTGI